MFELVVLLVVAVILRRPKTPPPPRAGHGTPDPAALAQLLRRRLSLADAVGEDLVRRRRAIEES